MNNTIFRRALSLLLCLVMVFGLLPTIALSSNAAATDSVRDFVVGSKKADPSTINGWEAYFGPQKMDTEFAGAVWTDKSVFSAATDDLPGVSLTDSNNFLVALSAIASNLSITGHTSAPTDTMLVLDLSGSMVDGTYEVGTIRQNNYSYQTATAIDMSLIDAMIDATNDTIDKLMKQNSNNRVGVVLYSGNAETSQAATPGTATVVLPLGRYAGVNGAYLSVDATRRTEALYRRVNSWFGSSWEATGESVTYVPSGTNVHVSVADGLKTEAGGDVADTSKWANGGTYIQNGLYQAMGQFLKVTDTTVPEGRPQAGAERLPVIVLMSDGAPTIATTGYTNIGDSNVGNGSSNQESATLNRITFLTQLTAAYVRSRVASHYQESSSDEKDVLFLTLGLGTENSTGATNTLYPAGSGNTLVGYWDKYLAGRAGSNVQITTGSNGWSVYRDSAVEAMNYVDTYYYASNAQGLIDSFQEIVSEISIKAESYATLVEGSGADFSGYVTFQDELGELMQVYNVSGILLGDTLFTGRTLAKGMNDGNLGTVDNPNARGDELVRTVKERIPGTTTQAQQLINNAYMDQQLYYANDNSWSNYIGWYADENGNYVGFWDKDSGYENAPAGAVYANKSYGYLGINGDSDMMHTVVMVRTELATLHQSVIFKIPAALLPMVQYSVTLDEDDPSKVAEFVREGAEPMRLVVEVGVRSDINAVNLEKMAGNYKKNADGTYTFYTNEWAIGNDKNGNGIPDPEEVDSAVVAQSHFHPALDNSRFYYTEDTLILTGNDTLVTGSTRPSGTGYYYNRYIYSVSGRETIKTPIAAITLANDAVYDSENGRWYVPSGTMYHDLARFQTPKAANDTNTLAYSFFPAVFDAVGKQDVYTFLGNNGSITVAPAQGIALTKTVGEASEDPNAPTVFTFTVTLSQAVAEPVITDTDGNPLTGIADVDGNKITVTLKAGQTVVISGIPTGTEYTVEEVETDYYKAVSANASGTVNAYTVHAVDFVNTAKYYGSLVVGKAVNYPQGFAPNAAHNGKEFTVHVEFTGDVSGMVAPAGAVQNGNTFTLTLRDGRSATFTNIPEGVTYTVTEDGLPAGYDLQEIRYSDEAKTIDGKDMDEVRVVNRYSLEPVYPNVKIEGDKTLVTNEGTWGGETFTVELLRIDNFADDEPESTGLKATMSQSNPHYEIDLKTIEFTAAGTYYFRTVEVIPTDRNENIAYDRTFGLFSITVADEDADGKLEIKQVDAYQTTGISGDAVNGWVLEKNFTNVVTTDRIYLDIQKHVLDADTGAAIDAHMGDITFGLFSTMTAATPDYYTLTNTQGEATLMIPVTKEAITEAGGTITYYLREIAPAVENRVVGMHYIDSWIYAVAINWDDVENVAVMQYAPIENDVVGEYVPYADGFVFEHTNTYEDDVKVTIDLTGKKTLNSENALGGREFSFSLYEATAAFVKGDKIMTVTNSGNNISFNNITFSAPGVYYMVVVEEPSELGGITIDATEYHITVEVEKYIDNDGTTRLQLVEGYPVVIPFGTAENVGADGLNFNNRYTVTGEGSVTIGGKKELSGRALAAEEFTIGLYEDEACTDLIESVTNKADGTFAFSTITYTVEDLAAELGEKTYTYYVKEIPGNKGGVTYDKDTYTVTVKVSHKDGKLVVTPSSNATTLKISNTYEADPVSVTINGSKALSGNWNAVENKNFTFHLFQANSSFVITDTDPIKTVGVTGEESFSMTLSYSDGDEGFYYYVLKEDTSAQAGGVGYDAGEYHITVNVSDPGDGKLVATTTIYRPGSGNMGTAIFTNTYTVEPTEITLEGTKTYKNSLTNQDLPMEDEQFAFLVLEGENLAATGYNKADGTIVFSPIRYTAADVHSYSVVEVPGDAGGVEYDGTVFTVTVTVVDNGDGTLTATVDYNNTPVVFENTYTHQSAQVILNGEKLLSGDWSAVPEARKLFNFELYETGADFVVNGNLVDSVVSASGAFTFGAETYTTEGTHYYVVLERSGDAGKGITYDGTEYHITVVVEDDGNGNLIPTVTATESNVTITADAQNSRLVTVDGLVFTNIYETQPAQYTPEAQKIYEREDEMKEFDFILSVDGNDKQTKQNDSTGKISFDPLTFDTAGVYELKIREQENILWGLIRWDVNVYTITLHVEDNGAGKLLVNESKTVITSEKGTDDLVFRNAHYDVITHKDVFTVTEPAVSIDGKVVEKNDILLYKISYTNYDSVPVDIEITDIIPQYTEYVAGSADNGGILTGSTLSWKLENVAPNATVTVSFQVKVVETNVIVVNDATVLEGANEYHTNEVSNPVKEDTVIKDVFLPAAPTVSIDGDKVAKNDILLYKVTYTNSDDFAAEVTITDEIPQYTTYVDGSADNGGTYADGKLTWVLELAAGESKTVSFQVKVVDTNITVINQATALEGENSLETNVVTNPVDEIIKDVFYADAPTISIDGKKVTKGDLLLYKITYTNADDEAAQVKITDTIPTNTVYVKDSADGAVYENGVLTWERTLGAGESVTVSFQVQVMASNVIVKNSATGFDGINTFDTNVVTNPVDEIIKDVFYADAPTISIDGKEVEKNDILLYKVTYTNADDKAAQVTITDEIPQYTTYVDGSADNGGTYADGKLTWVLELAAGESKTVSFQVKVVETKITVVNQAFALSGENEYETNIVRNPVDEDIVIKDVFHVSKPTVSIDGKKVEIGDLLYYTITYVNADDLAGEVTITDAIPQYTTYVDGSADNGGTYADGKLTWVLELAAGESKTVSFQVKVTDTNITVVNQATALEGANKLETNIVSNPVVEDTVVKDVFHVFAPTVSIDGKQVEMGDILLYKITYTNSDDFAAGVTITDTIPQYTAYVDSSANNGGIFADGKLTWVLELAAGESKTVSFQVKVIETNVVVANQAHAVEGDNGLDTNIVSNPVVEDTIVKDVFHVNAPTVSIDSKQVEMGDILLYKITYTNSDDFAADITITDAIPQHTTYVNGSADNGGTFSEGVLTWNLQLAAGESKTVSFQVKVVATDVTVVNKAVAVDGENELESNQVTNTVPAPPDIPVTGDSFNMALCFALILISGMALAVVLASKKYLVK